MKRGELRQKDEVKRKSMADEESALPNRAIFNFMSRT